MKKTTIDRVKNIFLLCDYTLLPKYVTSILKKHEMILANIKSTQNLL